MTTYLQVCTQSKAVIKISSITEIVSSLQPLTGGHLEHTCFFFYDLRLSDKSFDDSILWHTVIFFDFWSYLRSLLSYFQSCSAVSSTIRRTG